MKKTKRLYAVSLALSIFVGMAAMTVSADNEKFTDVAETDYFYQAVEWAREAGVTQGVGDNLFAPEGEITRAQIVTFLWNMSGNPAPSSDETFADVEAGSWYETAVKWAVENDITAGTGDGMFSPDTVCSRAMCITLLYRMMGAPMDKIDLTASSELNEDMTMEDWGNAFIIEIVNSFREQNVVADVDEGTYYELPVIWACLNGVITEDNTEVSEEGVFFRPTEPCLRKEMISFLYRTKLVQDAANAPATYEMDPITLPIPQEYMDLIYMTMYGVPEYDEDEDIEETDETVVIVSERASVDAAEAMGEVDTEGIGELFRILCVSENRLHNLLCEDMYGMEVFAKDNNDRYYLLCYPTDVRYLRETNEQMNEDIDSWTELNGWANGEIKSEILKYSPELSPVEFTNTLLDMCLARIAYKKDIKYTIADGAKGVREAGKFDGTKYAEYLLCGTFIEDENAKAPDGEYIVLNFPDDEVHYDFFEADKNLVREVRGDYTAFYRRAVLGDTQNTDTMENWYSELAKKTAK